MLGLNVAYYRKLKGVTQEQLADDIGISRSYISFIESPSVVRSFSLDVLFRLADYFELEPGDLLDFREKRKQQ